jgi:GT2 family glycosyltransferase
MNPVLILTHNGLEQLTKRCVESLRKQEIETSLFVIDNGSTDGTWEWLSREQFQFIHYRENAGVSHGWNLGLSILFDKAGSLRCNHVLVVNNDTILPPWFYFELLGYDVPFVTGVSVDSMDAIKDTAPELPLQPAPDFSAFVIRRDCWEKIGPFDEGMKFYAQDADYHIRACHEGMPLMKANVPFYHERSSTLRLAPEKERQEIEQQANRDREYFYKKWGFTVGSPEHYAAVGFSTSSKALFPGTQTAKA